MAESMIAVSADLEIPSETYEMVAAHAQSMALSVVSTLYELGVDGMDLPAAVILELAALAQIRVWQDTEARELLADILPDFESAQQDLIDRLNNRSEEFLNIDSATLSQQVFTIWMSRLAWYGRSTLDSEMVLLDFDEDAFIDALAQFVWQHRDDLFTNTQETEHG